MGLKLSSLRKGHLLASAGVSELRGGAPRSGIQTSKEDELAGWHLWGRRWWGWFCGHCKPDLATVTGRDCCCHSEEAWCEGCHSQDQEAKGRSHWEASRSPKEKIKKNLPSPLALSLSLVPPTGKAQEGAAGKAERWFKSQPQYHKEGWVWSWEMIS